MPTSPPSSTGSPPSSATSSPDGDDAQPSPLRWKRSLALFVLTVGSVLLTGAEYAAPEHGPVRVADGVPFAIALLGILGTHELGHFLTARAHGVDASLPMFLPLPRFSPFGTLGAVIVMRGRIRSRDALLDIGASGPLAGLAVALPTLVWGLAHSTVKPLESPGMIEGQSLLYLALKRAVLGPIPAGHDVFLHPVAWAGWAGLFVTMLNLIPVWQLDGGHVAYALFGPAYDRWARRVRWAVLAMALGNLAVWFAPILRSTGSVEAAILPSFMWVVWFGLLSAVDRFAEGGLAHPPTDPGELSPARRAVAIVTLIVFALIFMPTPLHLI